jgi:thioredoxin-related protein
MRAALAALSLSLLSATALAAPTSEGPWVADFDEGVKLAKEQGKDLFVDFTGSDWCGWCIRLDKEVFAHDAWIEAATKDYVLVKLDYPRSEEAKAKVPNPERNQELVGTYGIQGYPTILMMTVDGEVYGRTGYQQGGPEAYVKHMAELRTKGMADLEAVAKLLGALDAAEPGEAWVAAWKAIAAHIASAGADSAGAKGCLEAVRSVLSMEMDWAKALLPQAIETLSEAGAVDLALVQKAKEVDPKNATGLFENALNGLPQSIDSKDIAAGVELVKAYAELNSFNDSEKAFWILLHGAFWSKQVLKDEEGAKAYAKQALALDAGRENMRSFLEDLLGN